ncbi:MAG: hypothetical protein AB8G22_28555, partial [Saprospiraceae bacterium]
ARMQAVLKLDLAYYVNTQDSARAAENATASLAYGRQTNDQKIIAYAYKVLGLVEQGMEHFPAAFAYSDSAYHYYEILRDTSGLLAVLNNISQGYCRLGECAKGVEAYQKASRWSANNSQKWQAIQTNYAICLFDCQLYSQCLDITKNTLPVAAASENDRYQVILYTILGYAYNALEKPDSALTAFNRGIDYLAGEIDIIYEAMLIGGRGTAHLELGAYEKAQSDLQRSVKLEKQAGYPETNARFLVNLGIVAKKLGQIDESHIWFQRGLARSHETQDNNKLAEAYFMASEVSELVNKKDLALTQLRTAYELRDSFLNEEILRNTQELTTKFETERIKKDLAESNLLVEKQNSRVRLIGIASIAVALIGSLLAMFLFLR